MAFSYDLTTSVGQVRLALGDTISGSGVRPDGGNFTDAEIAYFIAQESSLDLAVGRACDVLATQWANVADLAVGPRKESLGQVAQRYAERAATLRNGTLQAGYVSLAFAQMGDA